jgi:hypothetical protein
MHSNEPNVRQRLFNQYRQAIKARNLERSSGTNAAVKPDGVAEARFAHPDAKGPRHMLDNPAKTMFVIVACLVEILQQRITPALLALCPEPLPRLSRRFSALL